MMADETGRRDPHPAVRAVTGWDVGMCESLLRQVREQVAVRYELARVRDELIRAERWQALAGGVR